MTLVVSLVCETYIDPPVSDISKLTRDHLKCKIIYCSKSKFIYVCNIRIHSMFILIIISKSGRLGSRLRVAGLIQTRIPKIFETIHSVLYWFVQGQTNYAMIIIIIIISHHFMYENRCFNIFFSVFSKFTTLDASFVSSTCDHIFIITFVNQLIDKFFLSLLVKSCLLDFAAISIPFGNCQ